MKQIKITIMGIDGVIKVGVKGTQYTNRETSVQKIMRRSTRNNDKQPLKASGNRAVSATGNESAKKVRIPSSS